MTTINTLYYIGKDETPFQYRKAPGLDSVSHNPYTGENAVEEAIRDTENGYGCEVVGHWLRDDVLWLACARPEESEEE